MKIFVISDTHRVLSLAREKLQTISGITHLFHLGDMVEDAEELQREFPRIIMYFVKGNNDFYSAAPLTIQTQIEGVRFFLAHGHTYRVKEGLSSFAYATLEADADFGLFGHTHEQCEEKYQNCILLNPSSYGYYLIEGKEQYEFFSY